MPSILEEFAYGNVSPGAQFFDKNSKYGKVVDAQGEANRLTAVRNLMYGYKLGLIMTAEAFVGMDDLYVGGEEL